MSYKTSSIISKSSCSNMTRNSKKSHSVKRNKELSDKNVQPKKVISSKNTLSSAQDRKCFSTGGISNINKTGVVKPKKTTKSDLTFNRNAVTKSSHSIDYCKQCGDAIENAPMVRTSNSTLKINTHKGTKVDTSSTSINKTVKNVKEPKSAKEITKRVQEYYKNENFYQSTLSLHDIDAEIKKISLDTITEVPELHSKSDLQSSSTIFKINYDSEEEIDFMDPDKEENISKLKEFRLNNYFECHSAKSRIKNKGSVINLQDHKCVYRFYLNERLFPVPLSADFRNTIRCVECHLPMDVKNAIDGKTPSAINGTIQAKVKLGNNLQDMTLLLPVKETMIVKEKKKELMNTEDVVYFGVIKLQNNGNSIFNDTQPDNSLALKYQKGYKEHINDNYRYESIEKDDVIVI